MRLLTRLTVFAAVAMLLSAAVFHVVDSWFGDNASVVGAFREIVHQAQRAESLRARSEIIRRRQEIKRDITAQLVSGRLSFRQAIAQFQRANELGENRDQALIPAYRLPTDPEGVGRQVFTWARKEVATWPSCKTKRLLSDLECEYETMFRGAKLDGATGV
ncbi:MAG TPA: hypothetical protein VH592_26325 [Gemmataceae bacterium]